MIGQQKKVFTWFLPFLLLSSTSVCFYWGSVSFGNKLGYFTGFVFYWSFWCLFVPFSVLGKSELLSLFRFKAGLFKTSWAHNTTYLIAPVIVAYVYVFPKAFASANGVIITVSAMLALVNATCEEILWRGFFFKIMGGRQVIYILFSSFGFAIWHVAPQMVFSNKAPGGIFSFILVAFILGALYSTVTYNTRSVLLTIISHMLFDFSGLGGHLYF